MSLATQIVQFDVMLYRVSILIDTVGCGCQHYLDRSAVLGPEFVGSHK